MKNLGTFIKQNKRLLLRVTLQDILAFVLLLLAVSVFVEVRRYEFHKHLNAISVRVMDLEGRLSGAGNERWSVSMMKKYNDDLRVYLRGGTNNMPDIDKIMSFYKN